MFSVKGAMFRCTEGLFQPNMWGKVGKRWKVKVLKPSCFPHLPSLGAWMDVDCPNAFAFCIQDSLGLPELVNKAIQAAGIDMRKTLCR